MSNRIEMLVLTCGVCLLAVANTCCSMTEFKQGKWTLRFEDSDHTFDISHADLGALAEDVKFAAIENGKVYACSVWKIDKDKKSVFTEAPVKAKWTFTMSEKQLDVSCSNENGVLSAGIPASEQRIPARLEDQDNGIMYTSIGQVTAGNIHRLFDRKTDTIIEFPSGSKLGRSVNGRFMAARIPVKSGAIISLIPDYYINVLKLKYYKPMPERFKEAACGWCSWYCYYMGATEKKMIASTDAIAKHLRDYGMKYIQLDACFTRGNDANWLEWTKKTFPRGGKWLFEYIKSKGLSPGLWVNIYGANHANPACADKYPDDFFLEDNKGKYQQACCTADKTVVKLDYSNPRVIKEHLVPLFKTLKNEWGMEYLKDAGWGQWIGYFDRYKKNAHDSSKTGRELYVKAQKALRETLSDDIYITGCAMHEVGLCFGFYDGSRTGGDDKAVWDGKGMTMQTYFHSIFGANYLNNICWFCDPDTVMVRPPLTVEEARTIVSSIALCGQTYIASDFMDKLSKERLDLYKKTIPVMNIVPIDLYPYKIARNKRTGMVWSRPKVKEYPRAIDLKVNARSGKYDVVGVFNWKGEEQDSKKASSADKNVSFEKDLGLDPGGEYLVFDFWDGKLKGKFKKGVSVAVPPHGVKVLLIRKSLPRPQLLATSRHVTCARSIKEMSWDGGHSSLKGVSETVGGDPYSLFIHVPKGYAPDDVKVSSDLLYKKTKDSILEVKLQGQKEPVRWSVKFKRT